MPSRSRCRCTSLFALSQDGGGRASCPLLDGAEQAEPLAPKTAFVSVLCPLALMFVLGVGSQLAFILT